MERGSSDTIDLERWQQADLHFPDIAPQAVLAALERTARRQRWAVREVRDDRSDQTGEGDPAGEAFEFRAVFGALSWLAALRFVPDGWWLPASRPLGLLAQGEAVDGGCRLTLRVAPRTLLADREADTAEYVSLGGEISLLERSARVLFRLMYGAARCFALPWAVLAVATLISMVQGRWILPGWIGWSCLGSPFLLTAALGRVLFFMRHGRWPGGKPAPNRPSAP